MRFILFLLLIPIFGLSQSSDLIKVTQNGNQAYLSLNSTVTVIPEGSGSRFTYSNTNTFNVAEPLSYVRDTSCNLFIYGNIGTGTEILINKKWIDRVIKNNNKATVIIYGSGARYDLLQSYASMASQLLEASGCGSGGGETLWVDNGDGINPSGLKDVGIGNVNPIAPLDVTGNETIGIRIRNSSEIGVIEFGFDNGGGKLILRDDDGVSVVQITNDGASFINGGTLQLGSYGDGNYLADSLSKTQSTYLAMYATDGTLIEIPRDSLVDTTFLSTIGGMMDSIQNFLDTFSSTTNLVEGIGAIYDTVYSNTGTDAVIDRDLKFEDVPATPDLREKTTGYFDADTTLNFYDPRPHAFIPYRRILYPRDFGAIGDGVADDIDELQDAVDYAESIGADLDLENKTYLISSDLNISTATIQNGKIVALSGGTWTTAVVYITGGGLIDTGISIDSISKGDRWINFSATPAIEEGDILVIRDTLSSSWMGGGFEKGEYVLARELYDNDSLSIMGNFYDSYSPSTSVVYKLDYTNAGLLNVEIVGDSIPTGIPCLKVAYGAYNVFDNIRLTNSRYAGIITDFGYSQTFVKIFAEKTLPDSIAGGSYDGLSYGINIGSSQDVTITNSKLYGVRHGITFGGGATNIVNRFIKVSNSDIKSHINYAASFHPNTEFCSYTNCDISGGALIRGANNTIRGCTISNLKEESKFGKFHGVNFSSAIKTIAHTIENNYFLTYKSSTETAIYYQDELETQVGKIGGILNIKNNRIEVFQEGVPIGGQEGVIFFNFRTYNSDDKLLITNNTITSNYAGNTIVFRKFLTPTATTDDEFPYILFKDNDTYIVPDTINILVYNYQFTNDTVTYFGGNVEINGSLSAGDIVGGIVTVGGYTGLRNYTGGANSVLVMDSTYVYNSVSYTTIGGLFNRVASGTENGGTLIIADDAVKWARVWDNANMQIEWWQVGGYSMESKTDNICENDADRWNSMNQASSGYGVILQSREYLIDRRLAFGNISLINGNHATIKAMDEIATTLTANASIGANTLTVTSSTGFRKGHNIAVTQGDGNPISTILEITNIAGNVLTINPVIDINVVIGDDVVVVFDMFQNNSFTDLGQIKIKDLEFDGNKDNNTTLNRWDFNAGINSSTNTHLTIENVYLKDSRGEAILAGRGYVNNVKNKRSNGSFIHISNNDSSDSQMMIIENCESDSSNLLDNTTVMIHSEGAITCSNISANFTVKNCSFKNGGGEILGAAADDDENIKFLDSDFRNFASIATMGKGGNSISKGIEIENCKFYSCGDLTITGLSSTYYWDQVKIKGNEIYNGRVNIRRCKNIIIQNNHFEEVAGLEGWTAFGSGFINNGYVVIRETPNSLIDNNKIIGLTTYNANVRLGLMCDPSKNVTISDNTIANFKTGITNVAMDGSNIAAQTTIATGWNITGNKIYMSNDAAISDGLQGAGILVPPGAKALYNTVYAGASYSVIHPIIALGVHDASGQEANYKGAIVMYNTVDGSPADNTSILVGGTFASRNEHNAYVAYNTLPKVPTDNTTGQSKIEMNTVINTVDFPLLTSPTKTTY